MAVMKTTREVRGVGLAIPRADGAEKVTGQTQYVADIAPRGLLHAKLLRSPHAHARIVRIDTSRARALPGVRAVLTAAERCERVYIASLLNLAAVVEAARSHAEDALVVCAGVQGRPNLDDTYVAGRIVELLGWERTDAAEAAARLVATWGGAEEALRASKSGRNLMENAPELEPDLPFCARESVLDVAPRLVAMRDGAAEIAL